MRKFPLQLLILLVVGNSIDRSTESSGKPGSKQGKEQSEELRTQSWGLGTTSEEKGPHAGEKEQGKAGGAGGSRRFHHELHTEPGLRLRDGETAQIQPQQLQAMLTRERLCYTFPVMLINIPG